jgi:sensor histidine kinase YesM
VNKFELRVSFKDWIFIIFLAIIFASLLTSLIYLSLGKESLDALFTGSIIGFCLAVLSFTLISINNYYILPKIKNPLIWWLLSALFAFTAGILGFYLAYFLVKSLNLELPSVFKDNLHRIALIVGALNYLIGLLIYLFIRMKTKKTELETLLNESRLIALNTQLNSHFLFNVLNSITELINIDPKRAEEAMVKLSRFLRKAFNLEELIPLSEELENVKTYIALENLRYRNMINLKIAGDEEILKTQIPKFSIQLLVENAVKHGFNGNPLNIEIDYKEKTDKILISVKNDGKAIENFRAGTGLTNLSKRISILCNGSVDFKKAEKTEFIIILPK